MEIIAVWLVMGVVVAIIANSKGYDPSGWFLYGLLIWPIALVHILTKPKDPRIAEQELVSSGGVKKCADCAELVRAEAKKCRFCGRIFPEPAVPAKQQSAARKPQMRSLDRFK